MDQFAARLIKPLTRWAPRGGSERLVRAGKPEPAPALSSATVVTGNRSARVVSLLLTLEALRAAPDLFEDPT